MGFVSCLGLSGVSCPEEAGVAWAFGPRAKSLLPGRHLAGSPVAGCPLECPNKGSFQALSSCLPAALGRGRFPGGQRLLMSVTPTHAPRKGAEVLDVQPDFLVLGLLGPSEDKPVVCG